MCLRFLTDYATRYRAADGSPSAEVDCFQTAIRPLRRLFGETPANEFGPLRLRAVRQEMIDVGWCRRWINKQIGRLRLIFRVGVSWEMVRGDVLVALKTFPPLAIGESAARETTPRQSVPDADLQAVRSLLSARDRDIVDLLLLCGCRPGELLGLTTGMIDRSGEIWRAQLVHHKTAHKGQVSSLSGSRLHWSLAESAVWG